MAHTCRVVGAQPDLSRPTTPRSSRHALTIARAIRGRYNPSWVVPRYPVGYEPATTDQATPIMSSSGSAEWYVSVDIEAAGPAPSLYSLLSIGACLVEKPEEHFYIELQPLGIATIPEAAAVHQLSLEYLAVEGVPPKEAMTRFAEWLSSLVPDGKRPVFVAFNAAFDWMFVNDYFHRFLGYNPFGHTALDVKAFYMGMSGKPWSETSLCQLSPRYLGGQLLTHCALEDALLQAELFRRLLAEAQSHGAIERV